MKTFDTHYKSSSLPTCFYYKSKGTSVNSYVAVPPLLVCIAPTSFD